MKKYSKIFAVFAVIAIIVVIIVGCKKENKSGNNQVVIMDNRPSLQVAELHNEFLSQIAKDFDYSKLGKSDSYEELHRCMQKLPCDQRIVDSVINDFYKKHCDVMDATSYYNMWKDSLNSSVLASDFINKDLLMSYIQQARSFVSNEELNYDKLSDDITSLMASAALVLSEDELQVLLAYADVLKNSAYFWLPEEFGGSGEGSVFFNGVRTVPKWVSKGILADAESAAVAFSFGFWMITTPSGLIGVGVTTVATSALESLKIAMTT